MKKNAKDKDMSIKKTKSLHTSTSELHSKTVKELQELAKSLDAHNNR